MSAELPVMIEISYSFLLGELKRKRLQPAALLPHIPTPNKNDNRVASPGRAPALSAA
jgi:hypothetical protein